MKDFLLNNKYIRILYFLIFLFSADYLSSLILKQGLDKGMGLNQHSKILIVGHSHLMMGLDKNMMEKELKVNVTKHTRAGTSMVERKLMTQMFLDSKYSDSLKLVIIGVDPFSFTKEGLSANPYVLFYPWMDDYNVGEYVKSESSVMDYFTHKLFRLSRYSDDLIKQSVRGWKHDDRNYKTTCLTDSVYESKKSKWLRPILFNKELMQALEENIKLITDKGIHVVLFQTPVIEKLTETQKDDYEKLLCYYRSFEQKSDLVSFIDYSPCYGMNYNLFFDPIHLNVYGQGLVTQKMITDILAQNLIN